MGAIWVTSVRTYRHEHFSLAINDYCIYLCHNQFPTIEKKDFFNTNRKHVEVVSGLYDRDVHVYH